jgi:hypothetical protein
MQDLLVGALVVAGSRPAEGGAADSDQRLSGHPLVSVIDHPLHQVGDLLRPSLLAADQAQAPPDLPAALAALDRYLVPGLPPPVPPAASGRPGFPLAGNELGGLP